MPGWSFGCLETSAQAEAHATSVLKILTEFAMVAILTVDLARSCTATFSAPCIHPVVLGVASYTAVRQTSGVSTSKPGESVLNQC